MQTFLCSKNGRHLDKSMSLELLNELQYLHVGQAAVMAAPTSVMLCMLLIGCCGLATMSDIKRQIIPNWLCYGTFVIALILMGISEFQQPQPANLSLGDHSLTFTLWNGLSGAAICFAALFPLWALGAAGAGDVKLVSVLGMILGPFNGIGVIFVACVLAGSVVACSRFVSACQRRLRESGSHKRVQSKQPSSPTRIPMAGYYSAATAIVLITLFVTP
jgi:prepilin peptidase CpaA